ncbi:MAG: MalY/PatB family protein [Clostridium sp.]|uniref:MalY/PatB family protein n=1 Tax=Clostridium sp. TaxID=1506 RepID=UPI00303EE48F
MKYNFDEKVNRINSDSLKWGLIERTHGDSEILPLWVADMDFKVPEEIAMAITNRLQHPVFGYSRIQPSYYKAAMDWFEKRFDWNVEKNWIKFAEGVVPGLNSLVAAFTQPGDEVIIQTPVYHPFYKIIKNKGCQVVENPLICNDGRYEMDFENLEKVITKKSKMMIICSPHNPVGRVWTKEELIKVGEICIKNNILIVVDEIHADIVFKPNTHTVFAKISEEFAQHSIICTAPNKTFNIAGFKTANIIIKNEKLRDKYVIQMDRDCVEGPTILGAIAQEAAYSKGEEWYQEMMEYVESNIDYTIEFIEKRIPKIKIQRPEGTYLLWLDCTDLGMSKEELKNFFLKKCKVWLNEGSMFGQAGDMFQRMNIATSREVLTDALKRIEREVNNI